MVRTNLTCCIQNRCCSAQFEPVACKVGVAACKVLLLLLFSLPNILVLSVHENVLQELWNTSATRRYCHQCGIDNARKRPLDCNSRWQERGQESVQRKRAPQQQPALSFEAFREAMGKERASGFQPRKARPGKS